jgi:hypothetical protein
LRCFHIVTDEQLEQEARRYGAARGNPQVVWPNGVLASTAVGLLMQLITPWSAAAADTAYLEYDGNTGTISPSQRLAHVLSRHCPHYPDDERGDPTFDVRALGEKPGVP